MLSVSWVMMVSVLALKTCSALARRLASYMLQKSTETEIEMIRTMNEDTSVVSSKVAETPNGEKGDGLSDLLLARLIRVRSARLVRHCRSW